jgi:hypothetical protein
MTSGIWSWKKLRECLWTLAFGHQLNSYPDDNSVLYGSGVVYIDDRTREHAASRSPGSIHPKASSSLTSTALVVRCCFPGTDTIRVDKPLPSSLRMARIGSWYKAPGSSVFSRYLRFR